MPELRGVILNFRRLTATANTNITNVSEDLRRTLTAAQGTIEQIAAISGVVLRLPNSQIT